MTQRIDSPVEKLAFRRVRNASSQYGVKLRKIATHIGHLVEAIDPQDANAVAALLTAMQGYAEVLEPWARATAAKVMQEIARRDTKAWESYSRQMGLAMREEVTQGATGHVLRESLARQVTLIKSLPLEAAQRVHELTLEGLTNSTRHTEIAKKILETGEVTKSRATLIARTEVARTASELTQARATAVGSTHYIWRGVLDKRERDSHVHMQGRVCEWANPPEVEPGKFYHAGCIYNCRCWPEPIVPQDYPLQRTNQ
jgi:SPP1 gp7 family putative phage head morphogenesis protein